MALTYTNYDPATGRIHQSGMCPNEQCLPPSPDGFEWIFGIVGIPDRHRIVDGKIVVTGEPD